MITIKFLESSHSGTFYYFPHDAKIDGLKVRRYALMFVGVCGEKVIFQNPPMNYHGKNPVLKIWRHDNEWQTWDAGSEKSALTREFWRLWQIIQKNFNLNDTEMEKVPAPTMPIRAHKGTALKAASNKPRWKNKGEIALCYGEQCISHTFVGTSHINMDPTRL